MTKKKIKWYVPVVDCPERIMYMNSKGEWSWLYEGRYQLETRGGWSGYRSYSKARYQAVKFAKENTEDHYVCGAIALRADA